MNLQPPKDYFDPNDPYNLHQDINEPQLQQQFENHPDFRLIELYEDDYTDFE